MSEVLRLRVAWLDDYDTITSVEDLADYVGKLTSNHQLKLFEDDESSAFIHELMVKISTDANSFFPLTSQDWEGEYSGTSHLRNFFRGCLHFVSQNNYPDKSLNGCIRDFACYLVKELEVNYNLEDAGNVAILLRKIQEEIEPDVFQIKQNAIFDKLADAIDPHKKNRGKRWMDGESISQIHYSDA